VSSRTRPSAAPRWVSDFQPARSGRPARKTFIERAAQLHAELLSHLTDRGRETFLDELAEATKSDRPDLAIERVVEAWYRTLELRQSAAYMRTRKNAGDVPPQGALISDEELGSL
jgi:hypothetical protein